MFKRHFEREGKPLCHARRNVLMTKEWRKVDCRKCLSRRAKVHFVPLNEDGIYNGRNFKGLCGSRDPNRFTPNKVKVTCKRCLVAIKRLKPNRRGNARGMYME